MAEEKETKKEKLSFRGEMIKTFSTLFTAAFGFVAALAWNNVVKDAINRYISPGQGLKSELVYALFVTALAVLISYYLGTLSGEHKKEEEKVEGKKKDE